MNKISSKAVLETNPEVEGLTLPLADKLQTIEKLISVEEFRSFGYLQELNRLFLHPLGLSLIVSIAENGQESLHGIADYRENLIEYDVSLTETEAFKIRTHNVEQEFEIRKEIAILKEIEILKG